MQKIKVGIIGAGGYGGVGAIELLLNHPNVEITGLFDKQDIGRPISDIFPHLKGFCDLMLFDPEDPTAPSDFDVVFYSTPDGVGQKEARKWLDRGVKVLDYSGDFRFNNPATYSGYAKRIGKSQDHASPDLLPGTVYGLAELHRAEIAKANLVGNPGCFAVSCILGLAPAVKSRIIEEDSIICDAKTGVSGAGKKPNSAYHYPARYDNMNAYKISGHQHVYEVERELGLLSKKDINITFTPHVIPMTRGILSTIYCNLKKGQDLESALDAYKTFYRDEKFVRIFGPERAQGTSDVRESNFCNLSINADQRTGKLIVVSMIDNLMKGQAGSAVQNMNIMFGLDERQGLDLIGLIP